MYACSVPYSNPVLVDVFPVNRLVLVFVFTSVLFFDTGDQA